MGETHSTYRRVKSLAVTEKRRSFERFGRRCTKCDMLGFYVS
jgi:hypothetical protein